MTIKQLKYSNESILRQSLDPREWGAQLEAEIARRKKVIAAPDWRTAIDLFAAEECPEDDPDPEDQDA